MTVGNTTTGSLTDSLDTVVSAARIVNEDEGNTSQLCDRVALGEGIGNDWKEISFAQLSAQSVTETEELDNPQQISDTAFTITPTVTGVHYVLTDRVARNMSKIAYAKLGVLGQNAVIRKKDEDAIAVFDGATTSLCGAGSTLTSGHVSAASSRILGNVTERGVLPIRCVLHPYQIKDLYDEQVAGVGTYPITTETATIFRTGFKGMIANAEVFIDGNIAIDSDADAKGAVFAQTAIVLVQARSPWMKTVRNEKLGGGATELLLYDEYAYGERSAGNWLYEIYSDATAPTS